MFWGTPGRYIVQNMLKGFDETLIYYCCIGEFALDLHNADGLTREDDKRAEKRVYIDQTRIHKLISDPKISTFCFRTRHEHTSV